MCARRRLRHSEALAIVDPGACNPTGVVHTMRDAVQELGEADLTADASVRLMAHQLCTIHCGLLGRDPKEFEEMGDLVAQPLIQLLQGYLDRAGFVRSRRESVNRDRRLRNIAGVIGGRCRVLDAQLSFEEFGQMLEECRREVDRRTA